MAEKSSIAPSPSPPHPQDGSDFLPPTTWWNRAVNWSRMLTGNMSPAGSKKYWTDVDTRYSELDCKTCEKDRDYLLKYSPIIRFMNDNIKKLGGDMGPQNIHCRTCLREEEAMQGGFDHKYGIKICANYVQSRSQLEDVLTHEMVHAYDHLRFKTNLTDDEDLRHAACSEVCYG
jgi:mitochondrial inner membrane protease ATP23